MANLCTDLLIEIFSYSDCYMKQIISFTSKFMYSKYQCRIIEYINLEATNINLRCCKIHGNPNKINSIITLKKEDKKKNHSSIHFVSEEALNIAKPFLKKYGIISHYCCSNTGVMYITEKNSIFGNYKFNNL